MSLSIEGLILIILYFIILLGIGYWVKRKETLTEYLIAGRKLTVFQTTASMFAVLGGVILVGQAALAYDIGFAAMWIWVGFAAGMILLGMTFRSIKKEADKHQLLTLPDYIFSKYDKKSGITAGIIIFLGFFAVLTGQFVAGASIFSPLIGISASTAVLVLGIITLAYLLLGGFKAVVKTDVIQFIIMVVVLAVVFLV